VTKASAEEQSLLQCKVDQLEQQLKSMQTETIMLECYNKRLIILIHGIDEIVWDTKYQTMALFHNFLSNNLKSDSEKISIVDIHRLFQKPLQRTKPGKVRPIIVKLSSAFDKHMP